MGKSQWHPHDDQGYKPILSQLVKQDPKMHAVHLPGQVGHQDIINVDKGAIKPLNTLSIGHWKV